MSMVSTIPLDNRDLIQLVWLYGRQGNRLLLEHWTFLLCELISDGTFSNF